MVKLSFYCACCVRIIYVSDSEFENRSNMNKSLVDSIQLMVFIIIDYVNKISIMYLSIVFINLKFNQEWFYEMPKFLFY